VVPDNVAPDSVVPLGPVTGTLPLYCVHPVSGSVYPYLPLARLLPANQPVYGLEAPGYDDDWQPVAVLAEISRRHVQALDAHACRQPLCLLGWSMGGAIAFDMACQMRAAGRPPALVIIIDTPVPDPEPVPDDRHLISRFAADLAGRADAGMRRELDAVLSGRPAGEPAEAAFRALAEAGLIPGEFEAEAVSQRFGMFRAHLAALHAYRAPKGYPGPVVVIRGDRSPVAGRSWADVALDVEEHKVPGDHYSIWRDGLAEISYVVRQSLLRARAAMSGERAR
jgi:thioesterase domain-containing protein